MTDIKARLRHFSLARSGELWPNPDAVMADEAADTIDRLEANAEQAWTAAGLAANENYRLRAVITRAKDALLDGQSTQWVHDLLVTALTRQRSD